MVGILLARICNRTSVPAAECVRSRDHLDMRRLALSTGPVEFVGAEVDHPTGITVISSIYDNEIRTTSMCPCQTNRQFVGFRSGTDKEAD